MSTKTHKSKQTPNQTKHQIIIPTQTANPSLQTKEGKTHPETTIIQTTQTAVNKTVKQQNKATKPPNLSIIYNRKANHSVNNHKQQTKTN